MKKIGPEIYLLINSIPPPVLETGKQLVKNKRPKKN